MGHTVSKAGLSPDPRKVDAIVDMPLPSDKRPLLRFMNVVKYQGKSIPGEAYIEGSIERRRRMAVAASTHRDSEAVERHS